MNAPLSDPPAWAAALLLLAACAAGSPAGSPAPAADPAAAVNELLAADRAFAEAGAATDPATALFRMFAPDVVMPLPSGEFARSAGEAAASLRANPANAGASATWTPVRGGISADWLHGFTFGYMTIRRADGTVSPAKYMSYWVRGPEGWRVAAYKRAGRPAGEVSLDPMPPALPPRLVPPSRDAAATEAFRASLDAAERAFSRDAQSIGLGAAFARYGSDDAVNMGPGPAFVVGAASIGAGMNPSGAPETGSPVWWAPDQVIVASSGDLGVTIGRIHRHAAPADLSQPASVPFFTIWRRNGPGEPWRYVAE